MGDERDVIDSGGDGQVLKLTSYVVELELPSPLIYSEDNNKIA